MPQWPRMARASSGACGGRLLRQWRRSHVIRSPMWRSASTTATLRSAVHWARSASFVEFAGAETAAGLPLFAGVKRERLSRCARFDPSAILFHRLMPAGFGRIPGMIQRGEDPPEGVVAGDAAGQSGQAAQPLAPGLAELLHVREPFRAAEQCADRDEQDVTERMAFGASDARVGDLREVMDETVGVGHPELLPARHSKVHF